MMDIPNLYRRIFSWIDTKKIIFSAVGLRREHGSWLLDGSVGPIDDLGVDMQWVRLFEGLLVYLWEVEWRNRWWGDGGGG